MVRQMTPYWRTHLMSLLFVIAAAGLVAADPLIIRWIIDHVLPSGNLKSLLFAATVFLFAYSFRLFFNRAGSLLSYRATQRMITGMRLELFEHIEGLAAEYHERVPVGDLVFRSIQDIFFLGEVSSDFLISVARSIMQLAFVMGAMFYVNKRLTFIVLPLLPLFLFVRSRYQQLLRTWADTAQQRSADLSSFLHESYSAVIQTQLLGRQKTQARRMLRKATLLVRANVQRRRLELFLGLWSTLILAFGVALVLAYGGYRVIVGRLTIGGLIAFYSYIIRLFDPLSNGVGISNQFQRIGASARRILEVMQTQPAIVDVPAAICLPARTPGRVEFRDVRFSYADREILRGLSLTIPAGRKVGIVGPTGSGKSTLTRLLVRLYEPSRGDVLLDGHPVRDLKLSNLRRMIAVVPQDPSLLDGTIYENILYGNLNASRSDVERAASMAQLDELLIRLPRGWNEPVGPRTGRLSGGERQRVVLARTFLQDPRIFVFDESTSAIDLETEQRLMDALRLVASERTLLVISHRLSAITWLDCMLVLQNGEIIEEGNHSQLYRDGTNYMRLWHQMPSNGFVSDHAGSLRV